MKRLFLLLFIVLIQLVVGVFAIGCKDRSVDSLFDEDFVVPEITPETMEEEGLARPKAAKKKNWKERIEIGKRTEVTWDDLYEFDYEKNVSTPFLDAIVGKPVKLPGFVIPLTDGDVETLGEFLIVPEPMMCIHVPPPPPNLLLYATADPPIKVESLWDPIWLLGEMKIERKESIYAEAGFTMKVSGTEPFEDDYYEDE